MKRYLVWAALATTLLLLTIGCTKTSTEPNDAVASDEQQLLELSQNELADYFSFDDFVENGTLDNGGGAPDTAITPTRWGRIIVSERVTRTVLIDSTNRDTARVTVTRELRGNFRISNNGTIIDKPFTDTYTRSAVLRRVGHTRFRNLNWRLVRVTAIEGATNNAATPVDIASVRWFRRTASDTTWTMIAEITNPTTYWQTPDVLPSYSANDWMKVEVTMNGSNSVYGQLHYRQPRAAFGHRRPFESTGTTWTVTAQLPAANATTIRRVFVDFMTDETIHDHAAPYSANVWGLLYVVNR